jgi:hypothetical protein
MKKTYWLFVILCGVILAIWFSKDAAARVFGESNVAASENDPLIGKPFNISAEDVDEVNSTLVYNPVDREYLVVWTNIRAVTNDIYAQRISEDGRLLSWFYVADGHFPAVAYNEKNNTYLVVYEKWVATDYDIYARRVDFSGPLGPEFPVAFNLNQDERNPSVTYNTHPDHDEFLVVWETSISQPSPGISRVEGFRIAGAAGGGDGGGEDIGIRLPIAVNSDYNFGPDVAYNLNMNEYFVVYSRLPSGGINYDVYARRVTWNGILLPETPIDTSANDQYSPSVAADRLNQATPYLVVFNDKWNDTAGDVRGYLVNPQGDPVSLVNIATTPGLMEFEPSISQGESWGGYLVTWTESPTGVEAIFGRRVSNIGELDSAFLLSRNDPQPSGCDRRFSDIALGKVSGLAAWYDNCGTRVSDDIVGRMIGYRAYLPTAVR